MVKFDNKTAENFPENTYGTALFLSRSNVLLFSDPVEVISARCLDDVIPCFRQVECAVGQKDLWAAGFVAYEAGRAFEPALEMHELHGVPLLWFGLYKPPRQIDLLSPPKTTHSIGEWRALIKESSYKSAVQRIRAHIGAGDVYQVNYTFPIEAHFHGDSLGFFIQLAKAQQSEYAAFINAGKYHVLSLSPELFFELSENQIRVKPMKGTRPRGLRLRDDLQLANELAASEKDKAENLMIVDLIRNDLGRIADIGSVKVTSLFDIERYPTVWQMTSTIEATTSVSLLDIFKALFPCGSVTGAPKIQMTKVAKTLEPFPRGVYCGAVGWYAPNRRARFNVAIRTAVVEMDKQVVRFGVGGGITWDSSETAEYEECMVKARFLTLKHPEFELLETMLYDDGFFLLELHLARLSESARYFGFSYDEKRISDALRITEKNLKQTKCKSKVRLRLSQKGNVSIDIEPLRAPKIPRVGLSRIRVEPNNVFLYHKTTNRTIYEDALRSRPDCDEVILVNTKEEITEASIANIVLATDTGYFTPPVECGLLPGTFREYLLKRGIIQETVLTQNDLEKARAVWLINSVRKWYPALLVD
ncbi:MAG TPA: aminodeoxychorismate synthase component I [Candidatus Hydrogenedentes bacterium]|nr:aminodeoxychorismate synthase component I [Candidatus Hydrogenedentota bacterium]HOL77689.1 aminodeoxychorismate synthase component I [Candidatus Hydrogenedentota bacterium]HPO86812.1 aminodeoxychorismate synthase component I [Candidatus Hydrogenedentota bacterium]